MNIHAFYHAPFEKLGIIEKWILKKRHILTETNFYKNMELPSFEDIEGFIIMGGPMGVYDDYKYYWLRYEKEFIEKAVKLNKKILGICLGAQLLANVLGAKVYKNKVKEIGWFPIAKTVKEKDNSIIDIFPDDLEVFHWHGDTFDLPKSSLGFYSSVATENQSFLYGKNILGLQFHIESTIDTVKELINNGRNEIIPDNYIQSEKEIIDNTIMYETEANRVLYKVLDNFFI